MCGCNSQVPSAIKQMYKEVSTRQPSATETVTTATCSSTAGDADILHSAVKPMLVTTHQPVATETVTMATTGSTASDVDILPSAVKPMLLASQQPSATETVTAAGRSNAAGDVTTVAETRALCDESSTSHNDVHPAAIANTASLSNDASSMELSRRQVCVSVCVRVAPSVLAP